MVEVQNTQTHTKRWKKKEVVVVERQKKKQQVILWNSQEENQSQEKKKCYDVTKKGIEEHHTYVQMCGVGKKEMRVHSRAVRDLHCLTPRKQANGTHTHTHRYTKKKTSWPLCAQPWRDVSHDQLSYFFLSFLVELSTSLKPRWKCVFEFFFSFSFLWFI